ncbi:MAG: NADH-quinone oxidoreductase subunit C [Chloroflexota bacterium]|nr:NADH-quinone oxidoreductase subunit C [Chloroflexota bacterium]
MQFDYLVDVTAVDWLPREPRFDVVYHLHSIPLNASLRLKTRAADLQPVPSVAGIWRLADWGERETYDMFGIRFEGHPDLRRILLPEDWEDGFPLRKDFPIGGYGLWAADNVPFR